VTGFGWWRRARHDDQAIALANSGHKPPAPGSAPSPSQAPVPGPRHAHGGVTTTIRIYQCGCVHAYDPRGALTEVIPCWGPTDLDDELRRLTP
jgi:hypothetical protein